MTARNPESTYQYTHHKSGETPSPIHSNHLAGGRENLVEENIWSVRAKRLYDLGTTQVAQA
jgi:hypothetical protein